MLARTAVSPSTEKINKETEPVEPAYTSRYACALGQSYKDQQATGDAMPPRPEGASQLTGKRTASRDGMAAAAAATAPPRGRLESGRGRTSLHTTESSATLSPRPSVRQTELAALAAPSRRSPALQAASVRRPKGTRGPSSNTRVAPPRRSKADSARGRGRSSVHASTPHSAVSSRTPAHRISQDVALHRLQKAFRWCLMRLALQRTVPVTRRSIDSTGDGDAAAEEAAAPVMESRFLHRLRAELHRNERASELRTDVAKRTMTTALRRWAHHRYHRQRHLSLRGSVMAAFVTDPFLGAELDAALCTVQAVLRGCQSRRLVGHRSDLARQRAAVAVIERAWQRAPMYGVATRRIHDRQACEVLCRQEAVERRDLARVHFVFLVRCHQAFYNDPRMWDAGAAIRRVPLYTPHGLLGADDAADPEWSGVVTPGLSCAETPVRIGSPGTDADLSLGPSRLRAPTATFQSGGPGVGHASVFDGAGPLSFHAHLVQGAGGAARGVDSGGSRATGWGAAGEGTISRVTSGLLRPRSGSTRSVGGVAGDVDAELRLCSYRLFFSPEEWRLLEEAAAAQQVQPASPLLSSFSTLVSVRAEEASSVVAPGRALQAVEVPSAVSYAVAGIDPTMPAPTYAQEFAAALTVLRQPRIFDNSGRRTVQHLRTVRGDALCILQDLRTDGYLTAAQSAPFLRAGLHYQALAQCDADLSSFAATAAMRTCRPQVAAHLACPATELRRCLVGAIQGSGAAADSFLPVVLEERKCRARAAVTAARPAVPPRAAGEARLSPAAPSRLAISGVMRGGFANAATQALFAAPAAVPQFGSPAEGTSSPAAAAAAAAGASSPTRRSSAAAASLTAEWTLRLAGGTSELGPYWREFLLALRVDTLPGASAGARAESRGVVEVTSSLKSRSLSPPPPPLLASANRQRRGLESQLCPGPAATSFLLQDFTPTAMRRRALGGAAGRTVASASGAVAIAPRGNRGVTASSLSSSSSTAAIVPSTEWWDAVERLLRQEYVDRTALLAGEAALRHSIAVLRRMADARVVPDAEE